MRIRSLVWLLAGSLLMIRGLVASEAPFGEPLMDWSLWEQHRLSVQHPAGYLQAADLENARQNIARYRWAADFARRAEDAARPHLQRLTPEFIEQMIPATTALPCYQCPACHDLGLPGHPGGEWSWTVDDPEVLTCSRCKTVFPHADYPETIVLEAKSETGKGQSFSFFGGRTFRQWGYANYRPTFTGGIRAKKVQWSRSITHHMGLAYALTGKPEYAEAIRLLLLRFAEVYPHWLLLTTYGEIADMHPHVAAFHIESLPEDELVYPPNQPDRDLYNGFWASCRAAGGGQEGSATNGWLSAYTLTYHAVKADGTPLYTAEEKLKIERDLILESCVHLIAEKRINNKSVGNRIAVATVGIVLGHPEFVRFGLEGWDLTMDQWFLADGCTPESPAYALMSLSGIHTLAQSIRNYSDPPGYTDDDGRRTENLNLYEGKYKLVWQRMLEGLQGDLYYPPYADSYRTSDLGARFAELLVANYPDQRQYLALLKERAGDDLSRGDAETAIFFRSPGLEQESAPPLRFSDNFFPVLCLGQLRSGEQGRRSLALLSATHWGGHHHLDSLNLYYWKDGHELLTDLGYLWDHPHSSMSSRTFAHNTGMMDLARQRTDERGGRFDLFHTGQRVKVMQAASQAYEKAEVYQRTVVQVDHAPENSYLVDVFRMRADGSRDLVYHGPNSDYAVSGIVLVDGAMTDQWVQHHLDFSQARRDMDLQNIRSAPTPDLWQAVWTMDDALRFSAHHCGQDRELTYIGDGWGQRDHRNSDIGVTIPYIVRRHRPESGMSTFITLYEAHAPNASLVRSVRRLQLPAELADDIAVVLVETSQGTDIIMSRLEPSSAPKSTVQLDTPVGRLASDAALAVLSLRNGQVVFAALAEGNEVQLNDQQVAAEHLAPGPALAEQVENAARAQP